MSAFLVRCAAAALLLGGVPLAQSRTLLFSDASGLSAAAEFTLVGGGSMLEIRFENTSTGVPMGTDSASQILTGLSFDLGAPGVDGDDPQILGGTVATGPASASIGFSLVNVGASADVSGEWGYANGPTTNTLPNFISAHTAGATPFGGTNLDGPAGLAGPSGGVIGSMIFVDLGGQAAIQSEVVATLTLDTPLADLDFLDNGARVEYGSDATFLDVCALAAEEIVLDPLDLNLQSGLFPGGETLPFLGNSSYVVKMDDADDVCGITPGAATYVIVNEAAPISLLVPGAGCTPGSPGNLMLDLLHSSVHYSGPIPWSGPGDPACHTFAVPSDPSICGGVCRGQGLFVDVGGAAGPFVLTNLVQFNLGS